jgi:hypothetical protein
MAANERQSPVHQVRWSPTPQVVQAARQVGVIGARSAYATRLAEPGLK